MCVNASLCMKHSPLSLLSLSGKEFDYFIEFCLFEEIIEGCSAGRMRFALKFASEFIFLSSGKKVCSPHPSPPKVISSSQEHLPCLLADSLFGGMQLSWEIVVREGEGGLTGGWDQSCSRLQISG